MNEQDRRYVAFLECTAHLTAMVRAIASGDYDQESILGSASLIIDTIEEEMKDLKEEK